MRHGAGRMRACYRMPLVDKLSFQAGYTLANVFTVVYVFLIIYGIAATAVMAEGLLGSSCCAPQPLRALPRLRPGVATRSPEVARGTDSRHVCPPSGGCTPPAGGWVAARTPSRRRSTLSICSTASSLVKCGLFGHRAARAQPYAAWGWLAHLFVDSAGAYHVCSVLLAWSLMVLRASCAWRTPLRISFDDFPLWIPYRTTSCSFAGVAIGASGSYKSAFGGPCRARDAVLTALTMQASATRTRPHGCRSSAGSQAAQSWRLTQRLRQRRCTASSATSSRG